MFNNFYYREVSDGIILYVKIKANSNKEELAGIINENEKTYLLIKIKASAQNGQANKALINFLSKKFKIAKTKIIIKNGLTSPIKQILVKDIKKGAKAPFFLL